MLFRHIRLERSWRGLVRCIREWTRRIVRVRIELGAISSIGHDLAVGTAEARAGLVPFAAPDDHILLNVPVLLRRHDLVHDGRSQLHREKPQACNPPPRVAYLPHLRGQRQASQVPTGASLSRWSARGFPRTSSPAQRHGCSRRCQKSSPRFQLSCGCS